MRRFTSPAALVTTLQWRHAAGEVNRRMRRG